MTRPIGYYVHHHGDGHRQRALAIAAHLEGRAVLLGTGLTGRTDMAMAIDLADDRRTDRGFDGNDDATRPDALHYAPIDHEGVRRRVAKMTEWIALARPSLLIVDVSVEIAMLARLASVPTLYVRLGGLRDDAPHREAFRGATALLAPFHRLLDDVATPHEIRRRTIYAPSLGRRPPKTVVEEDMVLGVVGKGGSVIDGEAWAAAARATPNRRWLVIGPCEAPPDCPRNLSFISWIGDPLSVVARAGTVVGAAGDGLVSNVLAARRPFICIPEQRPFGEQHSKASRLADLGAAIVRVTWPRASEWPDLLRQAQALDCSILAGLDDEGGAAYAAAHILDIADGHGSISRRAG